ncbi:ATP-binding protein [Prevotella sp. FD3004]|uniref:ATP-binding protein n=1 Tax=Prevotella sp. FD3004 TaxID=1408309 RepID=UPI00068A051C|nr:ATP-binding protein [Prevotella sp. FD3004]
MTKKIYILIAACVLSFCNVLTAKALFIREYTEEHPLVIVSDWEFPPYEFRNDKGEPDGYNIEVLDLILTKLDIPHVFQMKEWYQCTEAFEKREADLIHALSYMFRRRPYVMTQNMITYYNVKAARLRTTPPLKRLSQLTEADTLVLKKNDYVALRISEIKEHPFKVEYHSSREALTGIHSGKYKYYLWGEIPLATKVKEYGVNGVVLDETDIPAGELRIIGYDKDLIDAIDDNFARLEQSGKLEKIRDKWFHPERVHNDTSPVALIILSGIIIFGIIALLLSRLIRSRVKAAINKTVETNQMMTLALNMGKYYVIEYDLHTHHLRNIYGDLLPEEGASDEYYRSHIHPNEQSKLGNEIRQMSMGKTHWEAKIHWNMGTEEMPDWRYLEGDAVIEMKNGKPRYIINTLKDMTEEVREERLNREIGNKYQRMLSTSLIAMSYYDKDGVFLDANEKMKQLCEFNKDNERYFHSLSLFDTTFLKGQFDPKSKDNFHICQRMFYPEMGIFKYVELKIRPTYDEDGELRFFIVTGRDLTAERQMYLELRRHDKEIQNASEAINRYEKQLRYLLENSKMYVWKSNLKSREITFSRSLRNYDQKSSLDEYTASMYDNEQSDSSSAIQDKDTMDKPFNVIHHFKHTHFSKKPVWMAISGIPTFDRDGNRIGYFGVERDITDLMEAQQKLKEETERAEDSGKMKSAFLANMTHEIRTPLNAIVGFSDLLPMVDSKEERMEFIRIIRNNCDMLMRLINDILEASNMGQALSIKPEKVDFSKVFNDICQILAQRVQEAGVEFIKDNPYDTFPATIDIGRIQQVLTNFTTNAVKYTHKGHIKLGYKEQDNGIYYYCEDTGTGIPKEKQASVFERFVKLNDFVQGTGLGLSICKAIAERCGGKIGVTSEGEGHGSTFWLWTPRIINTSNDTQD